MIEGVRVEPGAERALLDRADEIGRQLSTAIEHMQQSYQNPLVNIAYTFIEPLPVGLIITLISAAMLRRKEPAGINSSADPALA